MTLCRSGCFFFFSVFWTSLALQVRSFYFLWFASLLFRWFFNKMLHDILLFTGSFLVAPHWFNWQHSEVSSSAAAASLWLSVDLSYKWIIINSYLPWYVTKASKQTHFWSLYFWKHAVRHKIPDSEWTKVFVWYFPDIFLEKFFCWCFIPDYKDFFFPKCICKEKHLVLNVY